MIQETITHQDGTTNNIQSSQLSQKKVIFGNISKIKMNNFRRKSDKPKYQFEECINKCPDFSLFSDTSNLEEDQDPQFKVLIKTITTSSTSVSSSTSSETPLPIIIEPQTITSTSVTSFSDKGSIKPEPTANSWSKSSLLSYFSWNNSSNLKHKSSTTSDASTTTNSSVLNSKEILNPSNGQENLVGSTKKKKKLFNFSKRPVKKWNKNSNNYSNSTINSSIEISNSEQNDSAYETEIDNSCLEKKEEKKEKKKEKKKKKIRKTKLKTLSPEDEEYIKVQDFFRSGLPNKKIHGIIQLQMPTKLVEAHEQFKKDVAQGNNLSEPQICHRMFHGTKTAFICKPQNFINNKYAIFCKFGCGVCGIAKEGNRTKYSRYTQRMWFANSSATSLSYCSSNKVKAMFVVDVVSTSPNSILIIEKEEATIPKYLIVFE